MIWHTRINDCTIYNVDTMYMDDLEDEINRVNIIWMNKIDLPANKNLPGWQDCPERLTWLVPMMMEMMMMTAPDSPERTHRTADQNNQQDTGRSPGWQMHRLWAKFFLKICQKYTIFWSNKSCGGDGGAAVGNLGFLQLRSRLLILVKEAGWGKLVAWVGEWARASLTASSSTSDNNHLYPSHLC